MSASKVLPFLSRKDYDAIFSRLGHDITQCAVCGNPAVFDLCQSCLRRNRRQEIEEAQ